MFPRVGGSWISFGNSGQQVRIKGTDAVSDAVEFWSYKATGSFNSNKRSSRQTEAILNPNEKVQKTHNVVGNKSTQEKILQAEEKWKINHGFCCYLLPFCFIFAFLQLFFIVFFLKLLILLLFIFTRSFYSQTFSSSWFLTHPYSFSTSGIMNVHKGKLEFNILSI